MSRNRWVWGCWSTGGFTIANSTNFRLCSWTHGLQWLLGLFYRVGCTQAPSCSWQILSVGYLSAAALHALWNATGSINALLLVVVGVLSYAFLMAAILKARALSPTRSQNFATRFLGTQIESNERDRG